MMKDPAYSQREARQPTGAETDTVLYIQRLTDGRDTAGGSRGCRLQAAGRPGNAEAELGSIQQERWGRASGMIWEKELEEN